MKRIIEGQTYNTDTATTVARYEYENDKGYETQATLYVTRGGAFFIVHQWAVENHWKYQFETVSWEEVTRLIDTADNLEVIDEDALEAPPEATAEVEPGATLYIRMPTSLKKRVEGAARDSELSGNVWAMRCLEQCLSKTELETLHEIFWVAASMRDGDPLYDASDEAAEKMTHAAFAAIAKWAEELADFLHVDFDNPIDPLSRAIDVLDYKNY